MFLLLLKWLSTLSYAVSDSHGCPNCYTFPYDDFSSTVREFHVPNFAMLTCLPWL